MHACMYKCIYEEEGIHTFPGVGQKAGWGFGGGIGEKKLRE